MDEVDRDAGAKELEENEDKGTVDRECVTVESANSNGTECLFRLMNDIVKGNAGDCNFY